MEIKNNYTSVCKQNFKAKFVHSNDLKKVVEYAVEKGKFDRLNEARKNIESAYVRTRLKVEIGENEKGFPYIQFSRYVPKNFVAVPQSANDYICKKVYTYQSEKRIDVLKYAFERLIKLGNSVPDNKMFQNIVVKK